MTLTENDIIREIYPVTQIIKYAPGCMLVVRTPKQKLKQKIPERGRVKRMSKRSLVRLMFVMNATDCNWTTMLTLTYPKHYPRDGATVKADLNAVLQKTRRENLKYIWFFEFQRRGAPHIHILLNPKLLTPRLRVSYGLYWTDRIAQSNWYMAACPPDEYEKEVLKMARVNCHPKTMMWLDNPEGAKRYVVKYASKEKQKEVPKAYRNVGRWWGTSRDVMPRGEIIDVTEEELEDYLAREGHPAARYDLVPKYLWGVGRYTDNNGAGGVDGTT